MGISIVHVVDAITATEVAAYSDRILSHLPGHPAIKCNSVCGAVHNLDQVLPTGYGSHDLLRTAAERKGRIVGVKRQPHIRFLCHGNYGLQEIGDVRPHLFESVRTLFRKWGKVLHPVVINACQPSAAPANFFVVALHGSMRVEVVFHHRKADLACGLNRLPDLVNLLIATRASVDSIGKSAESSGCRV